MTTMIESPAGAAWQELALPLTCPVPGCPWLPPEVEDLPAPNPLDWYTLPPVVAALLTHLADEARCLREWGAAKTPEGRAEVIALDSRRREIYAAARQLRATAATRPERARREAQHAAVRAALRTGRAWRRTAARDAGPDDSRT